MFWRLDGVPAALKYVFSMRWINTLDKTFRPEKYFVTKLLVKKGHPVLRAYT